MSENEIVILHLAALLRFNDILFVRSQTKVAFSSLSLRLVGLPHRINRVVLGSWHCLKHACIWLVLVVRCLDDRQFWLEGSCSDLVGQGNGTGGGGGGPPPLTASWFVFVFIFPFASSQLELVSSSSVSPLGSDEHLELASSLHQLDLGRRRRGGVH